MAVRCSTVAIAAGGLVLVLAGGARDGLRAEDGAASGSRRDGGDVPAAPRDASDASRAARDATSAAPAQRSVMGVPRREDHGALIVLDLYGAYAEMGRQAVALLGADARAVDDLYGERWGNVVRSQGVLGRFFDDLVLPTWTSFGGWREDSGFFEEAAGISRALQARSDGDAVRLLYGGVFGGGSTVFAATRSATVDGRALLGRNVDWSDDTGRRRPLVARYHPTNGDLAYLAASWPLIIVPIVGVNAAGLAISINFFDADPMLGLGLPRIVFRRVLQRARTVAEAVTLLVGDDGNRGGAGFLTLADATGDIALAECTAKACAVYRPNGDWFAHTNHSRTPEMHARDEGRTADSDRRRRAMESAVASHVGTIDPPVAAEILRDRSSSPFINDAVVANLRVLNAAVVDPRARVLWHSTTQQPLAPFGEMIALAVDGDAPGEAPIPADTRLEGAAMRREVETVAAMRQAERLFEIGRAGDAGAIWDRLAADDASGLEPHRLAWARARVRWSTGKLAAADALLADAAVDAAPFEIAAYARVARAMVADRRGARAEAVQRYRDADAYLGAHPEYDAKTLVGPVRRWIADGLAAAPKSRRMPAMPDLQCIPR